jgi:hypothetical protein
MLVASLSAFDPNVWTRRALQGKTWVCNSSWAGASTDRDFKGAFAMLGEQRVGALLVCASPFFNNRRNQLVALAAHYRLPAAYEWREFAVASGLMSYGNSIIESYRQTGLYAGRILRGARAGRSAGGAADQVRACHRSQDRQGARP